MPATPNGQSLLDADSHRSNEREFSRRAETASSQQQRDHFLQMARTSRLLAKNAEWMRSTDDFLDRWRR